MKYHAKMLTKDIKALCGVKEETVAFIYLAYSFKYNCAKEHECKKCKQILIKKKIY